MTAWNMEVAQNIHRHVVRAAMKPPMIGPVYDLSTETVPIDEIPSRSTRISQTSRHLPAPRQPSFSSRKTTSNIPNKEPHIGKVKDALAAIDLRQRANSKGPKGGGQEIDGQSHGGFGRIHVEILGDDWQTGAMIVETMIRLNPVADRMSVTAHLRLVVQLSGFLRSDGEKATRKGSSSFTPSPAVVGGLVGAISISRVGATSTALIADSLDARSAMVNIDVGSR
ncbi:hypothetical protein BP5796_11528 [Coleophoma crateriformis]|uniref:Uncharacterized protein n=1 Tax=Coleophoma crateriformis TaxID=565419 RepID=A0A3D8QIH8_9HELO|nr:hypothetical protein BP5796_11528 [Coleophoma crateriformis]